jgi:hypothetical protein
MWGIAAPARNLERRAENLGAHKFSHSEGCVRRVCDGRWVECLGESDGVGVVGKVAGQQVCAVGDLDRAASRIGSVGRTAKGGENSNTLRSTGKSLVRLLVAPEIECSVSWLLLL